MIDETPNTPPPPPPDPTAYQQVPHYGAYPGAGAPIPPPPAAGPRSPFDGGNPSPVLAALLGLIPGVGAVYNGQIAKGIAHVVIFVLLDSLQKASGAFGFFVALWVFYQVWDAYQTAIARRDGQPLPDPLHLNNIGDHIGVHHAARQTPPYAPPAVTWDSTTTTAPPTAAYPATLYTAPYASPYVAPPTPPMPFTPPAPQAPYASPYTPPYTEPNAVPYAPVNAGDPAYTGPFAPPTTLRPSRFPVAAAWLIGIGVLFLLVNFFPQFHLNLNDIGPLVLIGAGVGLYLSRLARTGGISCAAGEDETNYRSRLIHQLRAPAILVTIGILVLIERAHVVRFDRSWPILIIVIGLILLLERSTPVYLAPLPLPPAPIPAPNDPYQEKVL